MNTLDLYQQVVQRLIDGQEQLPSLPSITLKIRQAISDPNATVNHIAELVKLDPSLSTLLIKYASSPIYRRAAPPNTIETAISMMGIPAVDNLVMVHSIKSLFILKSPQLKKLFTAAWKKIIYKGVVSQFIATSIGYKPAEAAMTMSLLTEIGSLALLSALNQASTPPNADIYSALCKHYEKKLSGLILSQWGMSNSLIFISRHCGEWHNDKISKFTLLDIINLAIHTTAIQFADTTDTPPLETLAAYKKLPPRFQAITDKDQLEFIATNLEEIDKVSSSLVG